MEKGEICILSGLTGDMMRRDFCAHCFFCSFNNLLLIMTSDERKRREESGAETGDYKTMTKRLCYEAFSFYCSKFSVPARAEFLGERLF
jgi:hypothetical protein